MRLFRQCFFMPEYRKPLTLEYQYSVHQNAQRFLLRRNFRRVSLVGERSVAHKVLQDYAQGSYTNAANDGMHLTLHVTGRPFADFGIYRNASDSQ